MKDSPILAETLPDSVRGRLSHYWRDLQDSLQPTDLDASRAQEFMRAATGSDFVAAYCIQNPESLRELIDSGDLDRRYDPGELAGRLANALSGVADTASLLRALRRFRLRESARIAWRDLTDKAPLEEVMAVMTELADCCVQYALDHTYRRLAELKGTPRSTGDGRPVPLIVLGLGKLGGRELNFSSDIDLIFAYAEEGETDADRALSNHEFFTKLGRELIAALDARTEDGYVFRVDMRLRPNGKSGPLALSFDATESYYQTHGRDWERYAFTKARVVAGDRNAGQALLDNLRPFVYRRYLDYGAFESIRGMKELIQRDLERKEIARNIKLGLGGIREIEFIAQSFQLIRGGREPALQTNRLFEALDELGRIGVLSAGVVRELKHAYVFLRKLEHRLQMMSDQQTHLLPQDPERQARIAVAAGHDHWEDFETRVNEIMRGVHTIFEQVFVSRSETTAELSFTQNLWQGTMDDAVALRGLRESGYRDPEAALNLLRIFRHGKAYHTHSKYGRERVDQIMPLLIHQSASTDEPNRTLHRLLQVVEAIGRRSAYLMLLVENPLALSQLVALSAASEWISTWISRHPLLLDELLDPIADSVSDTAESLEREIHYRLASADVDDLEAQMEILREIRHAHTLKVAAVDVLHDISSEDVARRLCVIAEVILAAVVSIAEESLRAKYGVPSPETEATAPEFGIVAYGKLGSLELGYHSDLDVVFLHHGDDPQGATRQGARSLPNKQYYSRLGQRVVHMLTTRTASGVLYEIDNRLRPSGRAGPLVTSLDAYHTYQSEKAWTWEHQALVRARMVSGSKPMVDRFEAIRREVLTRQRDPDALREDIRAMREKMIAARDRSDDQSFDLKQGKGGIVDIEFIVQYYVLRWAHEHPEIIRSRSSLELLGALEKAGLLDRSHRETLSAAYRQYLAIEHRLKLAERSSLVGAGDVAGVRRAVAPIWQHIFN